MSDVFGFRASQPISWYSRDPRRSNQWCLYCGKNVGPESALISDKEHLVGRKFVPPGTLDGGAFNFIFRACRRCNAEKAASERHISSVTLFTSPATAADQEVAALAIHKASRDFHPDGGFVKDAWSRNTIEMPFGGGSMSFSLVGPPRLETESVYLLATRQVQGLFSLVTTEDPRVAESTRLLPPSQISLIGYFLHTDWGNPQIREITKRTQAWDCPAGVVTARGFFKATLKRSPEGSEGWFWALEWNQAVRVFGAICDPAVSPAWLRALPDVGGRPVPGGLLRREVPLSPEDDSLFSFDSSEPDLPATTARI